MQKASMKLRVVFPKHGFFNNLLTQATNTQPHTNPKPMKSIIQVHCQAECRGTIIPIYLTAEGFLVRYRDGKHRRTRVFEKTMQAVEFAMFLARRIYWSTFAAKPASRRATPMARAFPLCPETRVGSAVEAYFGHGF